MNTTEKKTKMNNIQLNKWKNIEQTMKVMNIHEKSKNEQPYILKKIEKMKGNEHIWKKQWTHWKNNEK